MPERMKPYRVSCALLLLLAYLGVQALTGERGLLSGASRDALLGQREDQLAHLTEQRRDLETRVRYLRSDSLSRDSAGGTRTRSPGLFRPARLCDPRLGPGCAGLKPQRPLELLLQPGPHPFAFREGRLLKPPSVTIRRRRFLTPSREIPDGESPSQIRSDDHA